MELLLKTIQEFGIVAAILVFVLLAICFAAKWLAAKILLPMSQAGINYLDKQTEATTKLVDTLNELNTLEKDIRNTIHDLQNSHTDPCSTFSTVQTNVGIGILGKAVERIANASNIDVADLVIELEGVLRRQRT